MDVASNFKAKTQTTLMKEVTEYWSTHGLGRMSHTQENSTMTIIVDECLECKDSPNVGDTLCTLDEGLIEGILEAKLKVDASVKEIECYGTGHDHCKFVVKITEKSK
jgi:hypothetical protein